MGKLMGVLSVSIRRVSYFFTVECEKTKIISPLIDKGDIRYRVDKKVKFQLR